MAEKIKQKIKRFDSLINPYNEGAEDTRYKSWEWCHNEFYKLKDRYFNANETEKENIIDLLSLHLAFYLASWGMYRGSSYLLQRDYKAHKPAIKEILELDYDLLWKYEPNPNNIEKANNLLFDKDIGIYWKVKKSYPNYKKDKDDEASDTLTTKILLGTFGCIPAFDRYLKSGISNYKQQNNVSKIGDYKITQSIENKSGSTESFKALALFAYQYHKSLAIQNYPIMKCVDMYFWQVGYELDLAKGLCDNKKKAKQKSKLKSRAVQMKLCDKNDTYSQAAKKILNLNK